MFLSSKIKSGSMIVQFNVVSYESYEVERRYFLTKEALGTCRTGPVRTISCQDYLTVGDKGINITISIPNTDIDALPWKSSQGLCDEFIPICLGGFHRYENLTLMWACMITIPRVCLASGYAPAFGDLSCGCTVRSLAVR